MFHPGERADLGATTQAPPIQSVVGQPVFAPGILVGGRYLVDRLLASGATGEVYRACDRERGVTVALKAFGQHRPSERELLAERLTREVVLARRIAHPGVCRLHDVATHTAAPGGDPITFVIMQLLEGETLADQLQRRGALPPDEALALLEQIAGALDAAHAAGVVHHDLKSSNVMLVPRPGATPHAVVTDFGLASALPVGDDPAHRAPEQVLGLPSTPRTDVYALGVIAFEMVTGRWPFVAASALARNWEPAILRCLAREPGERFARAGDFVAALRRRRSPLSHRLAAGLARFLRSSKQP